MNLAEYRLLTDYFIDRIQVGAFAVDRDFTIRLWNRFMHMQTGQAQVQVIGRNLFDCFPQLPRQWLERKFRGVFVLGNHAFSSAEHRPHIFRFPHNRPVTGGIEYMLEDWTLIPVKNEENQVTHVCVTLFDVTDKGLYQQQLRDAVLQLEESSQRDGLTGAYNRRYFDDRIAEEARRARRYRQRLSLLMFDLDHFKKVNDNFGHQAGDEVLQEVTIRVGGVVRESDVLARYGGEEFAVILPSTDASGAMVLAERLCAAVRARPIAFEQVEIPVTISIGVSEWTADMTGHERLVYEADAALYLSKAAGRNRASRFLSTASGDVAPG